MGEHWKHDHLSFEEAPTSIEPIFLGKQEFGSRVILKSDGEQSWLQYERINLLAVTAFLICFVIFVAIVLFFGEGWGLDTPGTTASTMILCAIAFVVGPSMIGILHLINRQYAGRGRLLVVTAGDETVTLPYDDLRVPWKALHAVTEVRGWASQGGESTRICQLGVIWRADSGFRLQPLATVSHASSKTAEQLAGLLHVPVLRAREPLFGGRKRKRRKPS